MPDRGVLTNAYLFESREDGTRYLKIGPGITYRQWQETLLWIKNQVSHTTDIYILKSDGFHFVRGFYPVKKLSVHNKV